MSREEVIIALMPLSILAVVASFILVVWNAVSPLSLRFNLSFLAVACVLCAINAAMFYRWI